METEIVGREDELARIGEFLERDGPRALLLEGEAGIGKTTLWRAGVALARERGYRVLSSRPTGSETQLSFAALGDLLDASFDEAAETIPAPQRRALAVALHREEPGRVPPPPGAVATAVVRVLHRIAHETPLVVAVDDVQWLDAPTAALLEFAARRVGEMRIGFLVARRMNGEPGPPLALDRALEDRLSVVTVGPLSLGALHRLLRDRLDVTLPRPLLRRVHDASGGNPFFALELARAVSERGPDHHGERLPLPETVHGLLGARLTTLPEGTRQTLVVAAASFQPTLGLVGGALAADAEALLEPAVEAGIVQVAEDAIRFVHPLFAEAVYDAASTSARRRAHEALAAASSDPEERARHLALSAAQPDAAVAAALDDAARAARARGAPAAAAELFELAIALTPPADVDGRAVRTVDAADALLIVGDRGNARSLLENVVTSLEAGPLRSDALALLSELVAGEAGGGERRRALIEQSLTEAGQDPRRQAEAYLRRDIWERSQDRLADALEAARTAVALAEQVGDDHLLARALTRQADLEVLLGHATDPVAHFQRALGLDERLRIDPFLGPPSMLAVCLVRAGRVDEARPLLLAQHGRTVEEGNEEARIWLCLFLAELEWLAGRWDESAEWTREGLELAEQCDARLLIGALLSVLALVETSRGDVGSARMHATEGIQLCESMMERAYALQNHRVLGFLELSLGNPGTAREHLSGFVSERGIEGTKRITFIGDAIEGLVQLGEVERAAELVDELEGRGRQLHREMLVGVAARCRGLVLASRGDSTGAIAALESAVESFDSLNLPFERARSLLVLGEVLRRGKRRRAARETLEDALAGFQSLGAPLWAASAGRELARVGGRAPAGDSLTVTERRVAELVAQGRSNKEVASALFVTVKAVEANLSRVYAKLGIRSRTELAHLLSGARAPDNL